nr:ester cyclase [Sciscionella marina]
MKPGARQRRKLDWTNRPNAVYHGPNGRELYGTGDIQHDILAMLAMLPDARMYVDEVYWNSTAEEQTKVAVRWTLIGTNTGPSRYGSPTGRRVRVLGISHQHLTAGRVVEEWSVYSEFNLLKQLYLPHRNENA